MKDGMENFIKERKAQSSHPSENPVLTQEVARALAMMKRVKKSMNVQSENSSEQQMPSYLIPDAIVLCQTDA